MQAKAPYCVRRSQGAFLFPTATRPEKTRGDMKGTHPFLFALDAGNGGGTTANPTPVSQGNSTADPAGASGTDAAGQNGDEKKFTQADIDKIITERLARAEERAKKERDRATRETELAQLAEKQEFQALAQKRQEQILELQDQAKDFETYKEQVKKYEAALTGYRDAMIKDVPANVRKLLDGLDIADQLQWLSENAAQFGGRSPVPSTPAPNGQQMTQEEKRRQAFTPSF